MSYLSCNAALMSRMKAGLCILSQATVFSYKVYQLKKLVCMSLEMLMSN
jgi:hypothetical protein